MALRMVEASGPDEVTLAEAAELLGVHPNTVRNRIRSGVYGARKVPSGAGPEIYLLKRAELDIPAPPSPPAWRTLVKQSFWSDDPRLRRIQAIEWTVGIVLNLVMFSFLLGRIWEQAKYEQRGNTPE
jgi:hypothetical protein